MPKGQIRRRVFNENAPLQIALCLIDMPANDREHFLGHWQRQKIREIGAPDDAPCEVLRHKSWPDPLGDLPDAFEMRLIKAVGAAERQSYAVQRYRNVAANGVEIPQRRSPAHVVLRMDF